MKREVGLWIDHTRAVIVTVVGDKDETRHVRSNIGKFIHFSGGSSANPLYGTCEILGKGEDRTFQGFLNDYYKGVASLIRHADSVWIVGPGEAKGEFEKHLLQEPHKTNIVGIGSMDKLTDRQIVAKVRQHYQGEPDRA
jgi:hypothetical protein